MYLLYSMYVECVFFKKDMAMFVSVFFTHLSRLIN